jgi:hypothetical protein
MTVVKHVLKLAQDVGIEMGVLWMVAAILKGICRIMDVELGVPGILAIQREKGTCFVGQLAM